jgi:hypothetical protein
MENLVYLLLMKIEMALFSSARTIIATQKK